MAVRKLPKDVLKMASGLILPSGLAGHCGQLCNGEILRMDTPRRFIVVWGHPATSSFFSFNYPKFYLSFSSEQLFIFSFSDFSLIYLDRCQTLVLFHTNKSCSYLCSGFKVYFKNNIKCLYAPLILLWPLWTKLNSAVVEINQMSVSQYFNSVSVNLSPTHCQCYTSDLLLASLQSCKRTIGKMFAITEMTPSTAFSQLKIPTSAFTFKTLCLTPVSQHKYF